MSNAALAVDLSGLRLLVERRGKSFALMELVQNAWDADDVTMVRITAEYGGWNQVLLRVEDDSPEGFHDLSHAYTLFASSKKKGDPEKRGRFNLGEKLVIALANEFTVRTTTGTVYIDVRKNKRRVSREKRATGSEIEAALRMTKEELDEALTAFRSLIPPARIRTTINSEELPHRSPLAVFTATLQTEIADAEGYLRPTRRLTTVEIYQPEPGETAMLYEMGIPVVETVDTYHVNVCVAPNTRILTADLRYIPAGEVRKGQVLVGFDEDRQGWEGEDPSDPRSTRRRFRETTVTAVERIVRPSYRLTFDDGTTVVCSAEHEWLTAWSKTRRWLTTERMIPRIGNKPGSKVVRLLDVWDTDQSYEGGYLAAAYDSEGSLSQLQATNPRGVVNRLHFVQTENEVLDKVTTLLTERGYGYKSKWRQNNGTTQRPTCSVTLDSRADVLRFLGTYRPVRLLPKLRVNNLGTLPTGRLAELVKKEFLGNTEVVAITTSTHTFVAEGLASHNCQKVPLNADRDNVPPAFLRDVRALVLNEMASTLSDEDTTSVWVNEALEDDLITPEAVTAVMEKRYGEKRVVHDPSDPEANRIAVSQGYTVIAPGSFSKAAWGAIRAAGAALPAGRVTPSPKPFSPDGTPLTLIAPDDYTPEQASFVRAARQLHKDLVGKEIRVELTKDRGWRFAGVYGGGRVIFNVAAVRPNVTNAQTLGVVLHEYAHHYGEHLTHAFDEGIAVLSARMILLIHARPDYLTTLGNP